jgi:uncharacterized lipoprotein
MLKGLRNVVVLATVGLGLSGCHTLHSLTQSCARNTDGYLKASSVPSIKVPLGVDPPDTASALKIPVLNEPEIPRGSTDPCLDAPPKFTEPRGPRPAPAV